MIPTVYFRVDRPTYKSYTYWMRDTRMVIEGFGVHVPTAAQSGQRYLEYRVLQQKAQDNLQGCLFKIWVSVICESKYGASQSPGEECRGGT